MRKFEKYGNTLTSRSRSLTRAQDGYCAARCGMSDGAGGEVQRKDAELNSLLEVYFETVVRRDVERGEGSANDEDEPVFMPGRCLHWLLVIVWLVG